jgi:hypothetical protein
MCRKRKIPEKTQKVETGQLARVFVHNNTSVHHGSLDERVHDFSGKYVLLSASYLHVRTGIRVSGLDSLYIDVEGRRRLVRSHRKRKVQGGVLRSLVDACGLKGVFRGVDVYAYVISDDTNLAPCVHDGRLSFAVCMPHIRMAAKCGDCVVAFKSAKRDCRRPRVVYAWVVQSKLHFSDYFTYEAFHGRPDCIYSHI